MKSSIISSGEKSGTKISGRDAFMRRPDRTHLFKEKFHTKPANLIIIFGLLQLFIALLTESLTLTHEEAMWHYIGRNWFRHGLVPYSGGIDNKSPLIFSIFGLSDFLFGVNNFQQRTCHIIFAACFLLNEYI